RRERAAARGRRLQRVLDALRRRRRRLPDRVLDAGVVAEGGRVAARGAHRHRGQYPARDDSDAARPVSGHRRAGDLAARDFGHLHVPAGAAHHLLAWLGGHAGAGTQEGGGVMSSRYARVTLVLLLVALVPTVVNSYFGST